MKQCRLFFYLMICLIGWTWISSVSAADVIVLSSDSPVQVSSDNAKIYGSSHNNNVIIEPGTKAQLIHFPGNNYIRINTESDIFTITRSGAVVTFEGTDGTILKIPATKSTQVIEFNDLVQDLVITNNQVTLGDQVVTTATSPIGEALFEKARAVLTGAVSEAVVSVYQISDLETPIYQSQTDGNGFFSVSTNEISGDELFLVSVSGGSDKETGDTIKDPGTLKALMTGKDFLKGNFIVSPLTDIAWLYTRNLVNETDKKGILKRFDELAGHFFIGDLNGDEAISRMDLLAFSPQSTTDQYALNFDYQIISEPGSDGFSILDCYYLHLPDIQSTLLDNFFGDRLTLYPKKDASEKVKLEVAVSGEGRLFSDDTAVTIDTDYANVASAFYNPTDDPLVTLTASPQPGSQILDWQGCDSLSEDRTRCFVNMRTDRLVTLYFGYETTEINQNFSLVDLTHETVTLSQDQVVLDVVLASGTIPDLDSLFPGDVVVSGSGHGFLRRIVSVQKNATDHYTLTTEDVALEEVILQGSGYFFKEMTHSDLMAPDTASRMFQSFTQSDGLEKQVQLLPGKSTDDRVFRLVFGSSPSDTNKQLSSEGEIKYTDPKTGVELTLSGSIDVKIDIEHGMNFKLLKGLQDFTFIPRVDAEQSLSISVGGEWEGEPLRKKLKTLYFNPIGFFIGPAPVVIMPEVDLYIGVDAKIGAKVYAEVQFTQTARGGIVYNRNSGVNTVREFLISHDFTSPTLEGSAEAVPYVSGEPSMTIYGITGPGLFLKGYLKLKGEAEVPLFYSEPCSTGFFLSTFFGMDAGFKWDIGLLENLLGKWTKNIDLSMSLAKQEWLLKKWNIGGECALPPYLEVTGPDIIRTVSPDSLEIISQVYTLKNTGSSPMDWDVKFIEDAAISVYPSFGNNLVSEQTATVTTDIDTGRLSEGLYRNTLNFNNLCDPGLLSGYASGSTFRQVEIQKTVEPTYMTVSIIQSATTVNTGESISFQADVTGGIGPYTYEWDFGDGHTSDVSSPSHVYTLAGNVTIVLTVKDSAQKNKSASVSVTVTASSNGLLFENFGLTELSYEDKSDWDQIVEEVFGSNYRVADWNDLKNYYSMGGDLLLLFDRLGMTSYGDSAFVTRNGSRMYSSTRYYFVSRHEYNLPSHYLAHDNIDNYLLSLGSWYTTKQILAFKP